MTRIVMKFGVFTIAVLLAELVKELILEHIPTYHSSSPYKVTAVSMALAVLVFVPTFAFLEKYIKATATQYMKTSTIIPAGRFVSVLLGLAFALLLLYAGFLYVRYDIQLHKTVLSVFRRH